MIKPTLEDLVTSGVKVSVFWSNRVRAALVVMKTIRTIWMCINQTHPNKRVLTHPSRTKRYRHKNQQRGETATGNTQSATSQWTDVEILRCIWLATFFLSAILFQNQKRFLIVDIWLLPFPKLLIWRCHLRYTYFSPPLPSSPSLFPLFSMYKIPSVSIYKPLIYKKRGKIDTCNKVHLKNLSWRKRYQPHFFPSLIPNLSVKPTVNENIK